MEFIFIILSWMILLVPGFDDSVPPTGNKIFKIETNPDIVESIKVQSDESFDFTGFDIVLKQNSTGILEIKIPKNLPHPASYIGFWAYDERPIVLADGFEIGYDIVEDPCYSHYRIPIEDKTNLKILYTVILTGSWQLYNPMQFDKDNPCYSKVFYEKPLDSPLKQLKSGIAPKDVVCKPGLELVMKKSNGQPICVKGTSMKSLTLRDYISEYNGALGGEIPSDEIVIGIPHTLPVINNAEIESMVELFQSRYHTSQIAFVGPKIVLNATNVWGETISLVIQPFDDVIDATLTCNHNDWRKQEIITENVIDHLKNKNCFNPALEETTNENNLESESNAKSEDELYAIIESFKEKYDAVIEGTVLWCMGHKSYPVRYQCDVQVEQYIKFDGEKTSQLTILGYRETYTGDGLKAIFGLDYHEDENYYEIIERVLLEDEN